MNIRKLAKKLFFPPVWIIALLAVFSAAAIAFVFVKGFEESPLSYAVYVLAFYTLMVLCLFFTAVFPKRYKEIKSRVYEHPLGNRYLTDAALRTHVSLYMSLAVNLFYVGVNVLSYVLYRSMWFVILAVYYAILAVMRFLLVRYAGKHGIGKKRLGELKRSRLCACVLLSVNFVLSGAVLMILFQNRGFEYHGMLIYVMAAYTFYITVHAAVSLVKYSRYNSPVMTMSKTIALSAALVSMLSLETAMFSQFGQDMLPETKRLMIALTGAGVSIVVVAVSIIMIVRATKEIRKFRSN